MNFQTAAKVLSLAFLLVLVAACSNEKTASKENFRKAIQAYYDGLPGLCATPPAEAVPFRLSVQPAWSFIRPSLQERAEALVAAGLLTRTTLPRDAIGNQDNEFQLTPAGSKALVKGAGTNRAAGDAFCTGKYRVKEIVNFTEPGDMMGTRVSHVTHTYTVEGAAEWARNAGLQKLYPDIAKGMSQEARSDTMMVLRNDGWIDARTKGL